MPAVFSCSASGAIRDGRRSSRVGAHVVAQLTRGCCAHSGNTAADCSQSCSGHRHQRQWPHCADRGSSARDRPGALAVTETHVQFTSIGSKQPRCIPYAPPAQARRRHRRNVTSYIHMSSIRVSITCTRLPFSAARDSAAVTGASKRCRRKAAAGATALLSTRYGARRGAVARACDARCMRGRVYTRCAVYMCPCNMHASMFITYTHLCTRHAHTRVQHSCSSSLCLPLLCDQHPGRRCAAGAAGLQHAWNGRVRAAAARVAAHAVC